jgi:N-acetyl-anhydromuramyl-L-alanine amidase AmpD
MPEVHTIFYTAHPAAPNVFTPGRTSEIRSVILHSSCGREAGDLAVLSGHTERKVSSHFYIARSGRVYRLVKEEDTAWHAGKVANPRYGNPASIGIEMEHFDPDEYHPDGQDWPRAQVEEASRLCAYLLKRHHLSSKDIHSHAKIADPPGRKTDPVAFPWDSFFEKLNAKLEYDWQIAEAKE